jgi:hypothetical protein
MIARRAFFPRWCAGSASSRASARRPTSGCRSCGSERQERARALTLGHSVKFTGRPQPRQIEADLDAAYEERAVLDEAILMQTREIENLRDRLSKEICATLRPRHQQMALRIAKAMKELATASAEEHDFRKQLEDDGIRYSAWLRPMEFTAIGRLDEPSSRVLSIRPPILRHRPSIQRGFHAQIWHSLLAE